MFSVYKPLYIIGILASTALLLSCGQSAEPPHNASQGTQGPSPQPTTMSAQVTLQADVAAYANNETIGVTLVNHSPQPISFFDHQTNCTVILLQQQGSGTWRALNNCGLGRMSLVQTLEPGKQLSVKLAPPHGRWPTGLYRATLNYHVPPTSSPPHQVSSVPFQVG